MKEKRLMLLAAFMVIASFVFAQSKTDTVMVYGNCGMCKNRIQKALKIEGISSADWNADTKLLVVTYDSQKISNDEIQKKIIAVGHDTEKYAADASVYKTLPGCCLYERKKSPNQKQ
jgi:periplasmic mercuric ion binding protein